MADTTDSKSVARKGVPVQVREGLLVPRGTTGSKRYMRNIMDDNHLQQTFEQAKKLHLEAIEARRVAVFEFVAAKAHLEGAQVRLDAANRKLNQLTNTERDLNKKADKAFADYSLQQLGLKGEISYGE